jgi:hypothetical protein
MVIAGKLCPESRAIHTISMMADGKVSFCFGAKLFSFSNSLEFRADSLRQKKMLVPEGESGVSYKK